MRSRTVRLGGVLLLVALGVVGCGGSGTSGDSGGSTTLTVFAAASLTQPFQTIGQQFEKQHDGVTVKFSFGGSSDLVQQIQQGAPADVFASADTANMDKLTQADLAAGSPQDFASNTLEIAVPPGNPAKIAGFADLAGAGVKVVVCAAQVPCGAAALKAEQATGVTLKPVSQEQSVTDVLGKVSSGEADAGLVYVTDVKGADGSVEGVTFPESDQVVNTYPIVATKDAKDSSLARQFVRFVRGADGQRVLTAAGFAGP